METREVTEVKVCFLYLNPINGKAKDRELAAMSYDRTTLEDWFEMLRESEPYKDGGFIKRFRRGSALEMYNPWLGTGLGIYEKWVNQEEFNMFKERSTNIPFI